jgi:NADPH:quinone reductase
MAIKDGFSPEGTGIQKYCIITIWQVALIPSNVNPDEAATFPLNTLTMVFALFHETGLSLFPPFEHRPHDFEYKSQSVVIVGEGSATGKFGIELTRIADFGNIIVVASKSNEYLLKSLGATAVIDRHQSEDAIDRQIREIVGDNLVYAVDCVGNGKDDQTIRTKLLSNSKKGKPMILVHAGPVDERRIDPIKADYERMPIICSSTQFPDITKAFWKVLPKWIEEGKLKPTTYRVIEELDAGLINETLDTYRNGLNIMKPHIHIQ